MTLKTGISEKKKLLLLILLGAVGILLVFWGYFLPGENEKEVFAEKTEKTV